MENTIKLNCEEPKNGTPELTAEEKLKLLIAVGGFKTESCGGKLPSLRASDGPCGLRVETPEFPKGEPSRAYPSPHLLANAWNPYLAEQVGQALAAECAEKHVDILLAPGVNIKRTPLCGRNFEYFSEDPYLAGRTAKSYIEGLQKAGIGASLKHFCLNNREWERLYQSSEIDERTLMEIYIKPFEIALQAQPWTVMCSYNPVCGVYASENPMILKDILREKLGYQGVVISDWGAVHDRSRALKATLDIEFPYSPDSLTNLQKGLAEGVISQTDIDESVGRILTLLNKRDAAEDLRGSVLTAKEREQIAFAAAREGIVLLKNEGMLPLKDGCRVAVVGELAESPSCTGGGSARVTSIGQSESLSVQLKKRLSHGEFPFYRGYTYSSCTLALSLCQSVGHKEARLAAFENDAVIVVVGDNQLTETESYDRSSLRLQPVQEKLILSLAEENKNVIVVVETGAAVDMTAWTEKVAAIVFAGFGGDRINDALASVLSGETNPSGKLSETFPISVADTPTGENCGNGFTERYREGVLVGYRYYDFYHLPVLFPFGFGLSYTCFEYGDLSLKNRSDHIVEVCFTLKNTGKRDGAEVVQIYVEPYHAPVERPKRELKTFEKIFLKAGEERRIECRLSKSDFAFYSVVYHRYVVSDGVYGIAVGSSSRDIRLSGKVKLSGDFN